MPVSTATITEGPTTVRGSARDDEQNRGNTTGWEVTVDKTAPVDVSASGELFDVRDGYINGQGTKTLTASAIDPDMSNGTRLSGIKRFQLEDVGNGIVATTDVSCATLACPVTASETLNVDTTQLTEGAHQLRIVATDLVGNVTRSAPWTVIVDRTAPNVPGFLDASRDPGDGITNFTWDPTSDPELADSTLGSGVATYEFRYRDAVGAWTAWAVAEADPDFFHEIDGFAEGQPFTLEMKITDGVGNVRNVSDTLTVDPSTATWDSPGRGMPGADLTGDPAVPMPTDWAEGDPEGEVEVDAEEDAPFAGSASESPRLLGGDAPLVPGGGLLQPLATTGWDRFLCGAPATGPCGTYDGRAAARYARFYAERWNREYHYFSSSQGGNCTNFVSQALHFGNFRFMRTAPGVNDPRGILRGKDAYIPGHGSWWHHDYRIPAGMRKFRQAKSFIAAPVLRQHLIDRGLGYEIPKTAVLRAGDIIFYRFDGVKISHANMVVRGGKEAMIAQNSPARYMSKEDFKVILKRVYDNDGHPIIVRPHYTRVNLPF